MVNHHLHPIQFLRPHFPVGVDQAQKSAIDTVGNSVPYTTLSPMVKVVAAFFYPRKSYQRLTSYHCLGLISKVLSIVVTRQSLYRNSLSRLFRMPPHFAWGRWECCNFCPCITASRKNKNPTVRPSHHIQSRYSPFHCTFKPTAASLQFRGNPAFLTSNPSIFRTKRRSR